MIDYLLDSGPRQPEDVAPEVEFVDGPWARREQIVRLVTRHHRVIEIVGGILLVGVGIGDLVLNLDNIRLTFGLT